MTEKSIKYATYLWIITYLATTEGLKNLQMANPENVFKDMLFRFGKNSKDSLIEIMHELIETMPKKS